MCDCIKTIDTMIEELKKDIENGIEYELDLEIDVLQELKSRLSLTQK